jgi:hypothetical protein
LCQICFSWVDLIASLSSGSASPPIRIGPAAAESDLSISHPQEADHSPIPPLKSDLSVENPEVVILDSHNIQKTTLNVKTGNLGRKLDRKQLNDCTTGNMMSGMLPGNNLKHVDPEKGNQVSGIINKIESNQVLSGNQQDGYNRKQETSNDRKYIYRNGAPKGKTTDRKCSLQTKELNIQPTGKITRKRFGGNTPGNLTPTRARKLVSLYKSLNGENPEEVQYKGLQAHLGLQPGGGSGNVTGNTGQQLMELGNRVIVGQSGEGRTVTVNFGRPTRKHLRNILERGIIWASRILSSTTYILEKAVKMLNVKFI